jgi:drug/metabolite transporter (DMT)-like permease
MLSAGESLNLNPAMKNRRGLNLMALHLIVLIWGLTGILGFEISLGAIKLVWWRVFIAALAIGIFAFFSRKKLSANPRQIAAFAGVGLLTAAHWICFFESIKASKISVTLAVISTTAFFVAIIAPLIRKEKFHVYEIFLGLVVVSGLTLIFKFENEYQWGITLALLAALLAATFSSLNSSLVVKHGATKIAFWEMFFALLGVTVFLLFQGEFDASIFDISARDLILLSVLGILCTGVAFIVSIEVMKVLSPFTCALAINMEPVYTILAALLLYGESEYMSREFYLGAAIIISTLFAESWLKSRKVFEKKKAE